MAFIVAMGVVSLFSDAAYEGARGVIGAYMAHLGAAPAAVGLVAGAGELLGYVARAAFGPLADRTRRYWLFTGAGYLVNLLSIPAMGLTRSWQVLSGLVMTERLGKAVRTPARDAMLSRATGVVGQGWGFGVHEALDQIGAVVGPLFVAFVLASGASFQSAFVWLSIPVFLALVTLAFARTLVLPEDSRSDTQVIANGAGADKISARQEPAPQSDPAGCDHGAATAFGGIFRGEFGLYLLAVGISAAGLADFALIAFHAQNEGVLSSASIPLVFALAMATDGASALGFGRLFDKIGLGSLFLAVVVTAPFSIGAFSLEPSPVILGVILWGIGLGAQESIMRSGVATLVPQGLRGSAYGMLGAAFGLSWFAGSATMGIVYGISRTGLVAFSVGCELVAAGILSALWIRRKRQPAVGTLPA